MDKQLRKNFNAHFSEEKYHQFIHAINTATYFPLDFRVAETPIFLTKDFTEEIIKAAYEVASQLQSDNFRLKSSEAIPANFNVPNEPSNPLFLQIDFAVTRNEKGRYKPMLIELQGFPSLYCFQYFLNKISREFYRIPSELTTYFEGLDDTSYINQLKDAIIANANPDNVILLEIEPEKQKTRIDFACTEDLLNVKSVCITKIKKRSNKLFYVHNGKEIDVKRIYNRVIFDELQRKNLKTEFNFTDDLDIEWAGHPNWFFRISKHTLPYLKGEYVPASYFLDQVEEYPAELEKYVLKPLYSFAGMGVEVDISKEMLDRVEDRSNYILQRKIEYAPFIETPDGSAKAEIRMMFIWPENGKPLLVNNLVRISKGKMMGVAFNKDKTWVGSSLAYHPLL